MEECNTLILRDDAKFRDNSDTKPPQDSSKVKRNVQDYSPIQLSALSIDSVHAGRILLGKIVVPPLIMKSIMTFIEDDEGHLIKIAVYNAIGSNLKAARLIAAADSLLKEGSWIGIIDPFYKRFMDGTEGVRVDDPNKLLRNIEKPTQAAGTPNLDCPAPSAKVRPGAGVAAPPVGSFVTLSGLKSRPELNGQRAVVESAPVAGRVQVSTVPGALSGDPARLSVRLESVIADAQAGDGGQAIGDSSGSPARPARPARASAELDRIEGIKARGNEALQRGEYSVESLQALHASRAVK